MRQIPTVCFLVVAFLTIATTVNGQSDALDGDSLRAMMSGNTVVSGGTGQPQAVQEQLDQLIESTKRAREERRSAAAETAVQNPLAPENALDPPSALPGALSGIPAGDGSKPLATSARSVSEIRERIRILQRLRRDRMISEAARASNVLHDGADKPALNPINENVVKPEMNETTESFPRQNESTLSSIDDSLNPQSPQEMTSSQPIDEPERSVGAERILPKPVNAMALGESLYQTGNYESALKALKSVDPDTLSQSDRTWLDLLIALCQRRTGDYDIAEGTLRDIANEDSSDYPVKAAKWWLKHARASQETFTKMNELSAEFDSLIERSKSYVDR